jgi:hypothetical protein
MAWNILAVRSVDDGESHSYPQVINHGKGVMTWPNDGSNFYKTIVLQVSVWEVQKDKFHRLAAFGSANGVRYTIVFTQSRVIVICPEFKKADTADLMMDLPGFYIAGALLSKFRTRNRALVGQIEYPVIDRVDIMGAGGLTHQNKLRVFLSEKFDGTPRKIFLELILKKGTEPGAIAQELLHRIASNRMLVRKGQITPDQAERLGVLQGISGLNTSSDKWSTVLIPSQSIYTHRFP